MAGKENLERSIGKLKEAIKATDCLSLSERLTARSCALGVVNVTISFIDAMAEAKSMEEANKLIKTVIDFGDEVSNELDTLMVEACIR